MKTAEVTFMLIERLERVPADSGWGTAQAVFEAHF
jgi:hypothetical protein